MLREGHTQKVHFCTRTSTLEASNMSIALRLVTLLAIVYTVAAADNCQLAAGVACVTSCDEAAPGQHHSCHGCDIYVSCNHHVFYDYRPCPATLYWDDNVKQCVRESSTCPCGPSDVTGTTLPPSDAPCTEAGGFCVNLCQSPLSCQVGALHAGLCGGQGQSRCCIGNGGSGTGATGETGATGATGETGATGATGPENIYTEALGLNYRCLTCIKQNTNTEEGPGGAFGISHAFWEDCGSPDTFEGCIADDRCARRCSRLYLARYSNGVVNSCEYYARVHKGGPVGYQTGTDQFWSDVDTCCTRNGHTCDE